ncbi:hypothetical protein C162_20936 [Paenibacillus sp. FSL R7-269]|uniref:hypothetical protein n=1 Tax=Paenibacillus sp. FSL R7-269 TaxID=1226755 RepID=UPI0003E1BD49|nr:hypothetical protein [Paenibacillus sp. FSL R7-269]ETT45578.1 hypothetical protein C162_20936 [Paenibacillus sp. FSL R7-269]
MKLWPMKFISVLTCFALTVCGCAGMKSKGTEHVTASDFIIPLNVSEVLKRPETGVIEYFQNRREDFDILGGYLLENEKVFQTRPVILQQDYSIENIQDPEIQQIAQTLFQEGVVKRISSLNDDPSKSIDFLCNAEDNLYQQGITYISLPEMAKGDPSKFSYVNDYKNLGGGWYYYVFHYDKLKNEDEFRNLAWAQISEKERSTLTTPKEKAKVILESAKNVGYWIEDRKSDVVVSVQFDTEMNGPLGPITMFFDPMTKDLIGGNPRF